MGEGRGLIPMEMDTIPRGDETITSITCVFIWEVNMKVKFSLASPLLGNDFRALMAIRFTCLNTCTGYPVCCCANRP
ncbi:mCG1049340 [Mus musculus]|nr:mCG1049340 [Mus musculus]